ncbi:hypothetical protein MJT46_017468 [Ovis ammon polii x Ovis aries]|nr:hypothetical protein MJT46_017468 [Ovis ammon polii x Ovis aries]
MYAACYMMVSLIFFLGFLLEDRVACRASSPAQYKASTVTQGSQNKAGIMLSMILYFFDYGWQHWWVILTITWFLAAVPKWGSEAIEKKALLFPAEAWGNPGTLTVILSAMNRIEGDGISGVCFVGLYDVDALRVRVEIPFEKENQYKLVEFMIWIGVFSTLYLIPLMVVLGCYFLSKLPAASGKQHGYKNSAENITFHVHSANVTLTSLLQLPALWEEIGDDETAIKSKTSTPATLRSLRLDHLHTGSLCTANQEDIRDAHNWTGSDDSPENKPSSSTSTSRQDSLQKAPKKKGIKSSIRRWFHRKDKGWPEHPGKEALAPANVTLTSLPQLPALREEVGDDETAIKPKTSTPATPLSLQLDRLHTGSLCTANQEDIRDAHNLTGSEDSPENNRSSSTSRQDLLQKALKKKGIKSSIRCWFHRKEKGRPEHPSKEALAPVFPLHQTIPKGTSIVYERTIRKWGDTGSSRSEDLGVLYGNHSERMTLKLRLPALREEIGDDETAIKSKISTPAMPQSLRLDRLHTGLLRTANQGDIRDTHNSTGSEDSPENNPSNSTSRQDSLQKAPKKKGITSSIRRWFHRKEKGRPEHPGKEALAPADVTLASLPQLPALREEIGDDETAIKSKTSTPATLRSLRLYRLHTGSLRRANQEDIRDAHNWTGSEDSPENNCSSSTSRHDSLQKAPKKKGITSSIRRWFHRKDKGRPEHPGKEALAPVFPLHQTIPKGISIVYERTIRKWGDTGSSRSEDLGVLYGNCSERMTLELRLPAFREEVGDDETAIKPKASTPAMLQSLRLDRLHTGSLRTAKQEDIRDTHNSTGSEDSPENNPSNSTSRQDSLQKSQKKKGIKSSICRWFHRKEKGQPEHPSKEALAPVNVTLASLPQLPALREEVGDAETAIKSKTSTPATPRSLRLDRLHTGSLCTANQEDIRDAHNSTGSEDSPENNRSSSTSRQDSLQKAPKEKGITSSIRHWFNRKEKGRPERPSKEALAPVFPLHQTIPKGISIVYERTIRKWGDTGSSRSEDLGVLYGNHSERMTLKLRLPALREEIGDDETAIKSKTSTPATPQSLRLDRLHTGSLRTANQEDIRDAHNSTGSEDSPENNPSNSTSRTSSQFNPAVIWLQRLLPAIQKEKTIPKGISIVYERTIRKWGDTGSSRSEDLGVLYGNHSERMTLKLRLPALREEVGDDETAIKPKASTPATLRSLRLDRLHTGSLRTAKQEDIRDTHNSTGSEDSPENNPSNSTSRQDSLQKSQKKKGIKSSICRWFNRKEKGRPNAPARRR